MNIDLLENNPSWTWYPVVFGGLLGLTIIGWLVFKLPSVSYLLIQFWSSCDTDGFYIHRSKRQLVDVSGSRFKVFAIASPEHGCLRTVQVRFT